MIDPLDKVRKLLALAQAGSGATEAEAATAMEMASALMAKFSIEQKDLAPVDHEDIVRCIVDLDDKHDGEKWVGWLATATSFIATSKPIFIPGLGMEFIGYKHNVDACAVLFRWLVDQVEALYKRDLPTGMSKGARADFRRTFKQACAGRVYQRANEIRERMMGNNDYALKNTGSTALVVRDNVTKQLDDIAEFMKAQGFTPRRRKAGKGLKVGLGTSLGTKAGNDVQLNRQVGARRLAITDGRKS